MQSHAMIIVVYILLVSEVVTQG